MEHRIREWPFNVLLVTWSLAALGAAIAHGVAPSWTAAGTNWPGSPHWQWEIAAFDSFGAIVFGWVARQSQVGLKIRATWLLCALSSFLGLNHLSGWLESPRIFHVVFTIANFIAVAWGVMALGISRRQPD